MGLIIFSETLHIGTNVKRYKMNGVHGSNFSEGPFNCDLDFYLTNQISKASENTYCQLGNNQSIYLKQKQHSLSIFITLIVLKVFRSCYLSKLANSKDVVPCGENLSNTDRCKTCTFTKMQTADRKQIR